MTSKTLQTIINIWALITLSLILQAQTESEPNDLFSQATNLTLNNSTVTVQGHINPAGDADYYAINVPSRGLFILDLNNIAPEFGWVEMNFFDTTQNLLDDESAASGDPARIYQRVCEPGTYYIQIKDSWGNDTSPEPYNLTITFDTQDVYECNNTFAEANSIAIGETVQGQIAGEGDEDFFKVEVDRAGVLVANVNDVPSNIRMRIDIYNEGQEQIEYNTEQEGVPVELITQVCDPGIYFFKISSVYNNDVSVDLYNLTINFDTQDVYECNNSFLEATPIATCENIAAAIYDRGDVDYFVFNGIANQEITIELTNVAPGISPEIRLYNQIQNELKDRYSSYGQALSFSYILPATEQYYLRVRENGNNSGDSQLYNLIIRDNSCLTTTAINEVDLKRELIAYPNPVQDELNLNLGELPLDNAAINIYNALGKLLYTNKVLSQSISINVSDFPKGVLLVEYTSNNLSTIKRIKH